MPRGITQDQVNAAADAILGAGENPTVEKVRAQLGTGSPNTVTRMLDAWRGQLGERLRQLSALPELPTPVGQAMMGLWQLATEHASQATAGRFAEEHAALETARSTLATERQDWTARLEAAETERARTQAAKDLAEHACTTLDAQLQDSHALRADLDQQRDRLQAQWEDIQAKSVERGAPVLLYEEPDLVIRVVRDLFNEDFRDLVIQGGDAYDTADQKADVTKEILAAYPKSLAEARGELNPDGTPNVPYVVRSCKGSTCGYYQYLQGTSMASPHATGVVALIVSRYGHSDRVHGGLTLAPDAARAVLEGTATEHACPTPRTYTYTRQVKQADGTYQTVTSTATCEGPKSHNGFYGHGIIDALHAVSH